MTERRFRELAGIASETARAVGDAIAVDDVAIVTWKKGRANFATRADHAAEKSIVARLAPATPGVPVLAEESAAGSPTLKGTLWVADPIDGTLNFSRGVPFYCVAIAYVEARRTRAAAVYAPRTSELFVASEGGGATLNGKRLHVAEARPLKECFAVTNLAYREASRPRSRFSALNRTCARLRGLGSAALEICYVAAGRFDLFVHDRLSPWDIAAPWLIVREAGGRIVDLTSGRVADAFAPQVCMGHPSVVREALASIPELLVRRSG